MVHFILQLNHHTIFSKLTNLNPSTVFLIYLIEPPKLVNLAKYFNSFLFYPNL